MQPLVLLMEDRAPSPDSLPAPLAELYGGGLELAPDLVFADFVSTLDGIVDLGTPTGSLDVISGRSPADRFVVGLLRAHADCILVGAGTARVGAGHPWTAASAHRASAPLFALLRRPDPVFTVVTATGAVDASRPPLAGRGLVLTGSAGAARLNGHDVRVRNLGEPPFSATSIIQALRSEGFRRILVEAGPILMGRLLDESAVEEVFLTVSPTVAGRVEGDGRTTMAHGVHLLPDRPASARLRSVRSHGSHLFLRYAL